MVQAGCTPTIKRGLFGVDTPIKPKADPRLPYWAVIQFDPMGVWGCGKDQEAAFAEALKYCADYKWNDINKASDLELAIAAGQMAMVRCSERLRDEVYEYGGEIEFLHLIGIGAILPKERILFQ